MPSNDFAPYLKINGCFIVKNISSNEKKTIKIFHYPINWGNTRDILQIPGVSESDIRASLLKGELNHKIRSEDIEVICSDIDLLQFNINQKIFLQNAGVVDGLEVESSGSSNGISENNHETLRQLIHFIDNGPGNGFASDAVRITEPLGDAFPTQIVWFTNDLQNEKIVEKLIVYNDNQMPVTITWNIYDIDGTTILHTIIDNFTYVNEIFESKRIRTII